MFLGFLKEAAPRSCNFIWGAYITGRRPESVDIMSHLNVNVNCYFNRPEWEREYDEFCADQFDEFEADNDNTVGWTIDIDHDFPGPVAAERNCLRFMAVMEELVNCEIRNVSLSYDFDGNPVCSIKYWYMGEAEADVVFKINSGFDEDKPIRHFASSK